VEDCAREQTAVRCHRRTAELLANEFVSDALAHRPEFVHVLARCLEDRIRVEVYDTRRSTSAAEDAEAETHSLRMRLLSSLADRWSMENLGSGQLNWFELRSRTPCDGARLGR